MAIIAATHDVAIDGYYLEGLDETGQSKFVGFRAGAYRAAMFAGASPLFILVGKWGWQAGWAAAAGTMIVLTVYHARFLPRVERPGRPVLELARAALRLRVLLIGLGVTVVVVLGRRFDLPSRTSIALDPVLESAGLAEIGVEGWIGLLLLAALLMMLMALPALRRRIEGSPSDYARAFVHFLEQRQIGRVLAFVILFRVGESFLLKMRYAFLEQEAAITVAQWGWINLNAIAGSIAATIVGGWLIARYGLRRLAWPFVLAQNVLNLLYMGLALAPEAVRTDFWVVQGVVVTENVGAGLGTAVFMVYIMRCCDPRHKAAHMAIVTALMSLGFTVAGVASGFLASAVGFATYFGISFVAAIPAMVLLPFVPHLDGRES
jgi:PAT family beta-lactamase induction signal transducer AmpG